MKIISRKRGSEAAPMETGILPRRKMKTMKKHYDDGDSMLHLNQCGISNMLNGKNDEAERCFFQALAHFDTVELRVSSEVLEPILYLSDTALAPPNESTCQQHGNNRQEYDEGMCNFFDPLTLQEDCDDAINKAMLLYNVGLTYCRRKKFADAQNWFEQAKTSLEQQGKSNVFSSIILVKVLLGLGFCNYRQSKHEESIKLYEEAIIQKEAADLGEEFLASAKNAIAVVRFHSTKASDVSDLMILFQESLSIYLKLMGDTSKEVATVLNNIGRVFYLSGDYEQARGAYDSSLKTRRILYDKDSIDLAVTICNLGQTLHQLGRLDEAMELFQEFLNLSHNCVGYSSHRDIAIIISHVASIHHERSQFKEAKLSYETALLSGRLAFGNNHSELASILNKLGSVCYKLKELDLALTYLQEGLQIEQVIYGINHPNIAITLLNIAQIHRDENNFASAFLTYSKVRNIQTEINGPNTLEVSNTLFSMGLMLYRMKAFSASFQYYQEALYIQRLKLENEDNLDIAATLNSMGIVLFHLGRKRLAKTYIEQSLTIRRKIHGPYHVDITVNVYNLATLHLELGEDVAAAELFKECLRIERKTEGLGCYESIRTLQHLALVYQQRGELGEALNYFGEALELERSRHGDNHPLVGKLLNLIGNIHLQRGHTSAMMTCYAEASRILVNHSESLVIAGYNFYGLSKLHPECAEAA